MHLEGSHKDRQVPLLDWNGQTAGSIDLPGSVFDCKVRRDIMHRVVRWQLAKKQQVPAHSSFGENGCRLCVFAEGDEPEGACPGQMLTSFTPSMVCGPGAGYTQGQDAQGGARRRP